MQINESDVEEIKNWLGRHWKGEPLCPICKNNEWNIGRTIAELRPFLKGKLRMGGLLYPVVVISCNICGHHLFFNAIKLDIVKLPPPEGVALPPSKGFALPKEKEGDDNV